MTQITPMRGWTIANYGVSLNVWHIFKMKINVHTYSVDKGTWPMPVMSRLFGIVIMFWKQELWKQLYGPVSSVKRLAGYAETIPNHLFMGLSMHTSKDSEEFYLVPRTIKDFSIHADHYILTGNTLLKYQLSLLTRPVTFYLLFTVDWMHDLIIWSWKLWMCPCYTD